MYNNIPESEIFLRTKQIKFFKIFKETFTYRLCPKKILLSLYISKIHRIFQNLSKKTIYKLLLHWSQSFRTNFILTKTIFNRIKISEIFLSSNSNHLKWYWYPKLVNLISIGASSYVVYILYICKFCWSTSFSYFWLCLKLVFGKIFFFNKNFPLNL